MNDERPERRRFQFGLRKLLLWTVVVAVLLGTLKMLGLETAGLVIAASWAAITAVVRGAFGSTLAHIVSAVGGGVLALVLLFTGVIGATSIVVFIVLAAGVSFVFVEAAWLGVDWLDSLDADVRDQFLTILGEVTTTRNGEAFAVNEAAKQAIIDAGGTIRQLDDAQRAAWVDAMKPVWEKFAGDVGQDMIDAAQAINAGS